MVQFARKVSLLVTLSLLTSAATAYAECAWDARVRIVDHPVRDSIAGVDLL